MSERDAFDEAVRKVERAEAMSHRVFLCVHEAHYTPNRARRVNCIKRKVRQQLRDMYDEARSAKAEIFVKDWIHREQVRELMEAVWHTAHMATPPFEPMRDVDRILAERETDERTV